VSPVVKEKRYFARNEDVQGGEPCRGAVLAGRGRSPEPQCTAGPRPRVALFSRVPRRL